MAGTRFDCKEHSLFDGSGTDAGDADGGPGVRGRRAVSVAPPRHSRRVACGLESAVQPGCALYVSDHRIWKSYKFLCGLSFRIYQKLVM